MDIAENTAEILEAVWTLEEQGKASLTDIRRIAHTEVTDQLLHEVESSGLIAVELAGRVSLTSKGRAQAAPIIRRHRLAERLFRDTFAIGDPEADSEACKFEHIISPELDEKICTFLGHPRSCPHGNPIPPGPCCPPRTC